MIVVVPSIYHTGTHLMKRVFQDWIAISPNWCGPFDLPSGDTRWVMFCHLTDSNRELYHVVRQYPCVVPMRHPVRVLESWHRRGLTQAEYETQWKNLERILDIDPLIML